MFFFVPTWECICDSRVREPRWFWKNGVIKWDDEERSKRRTPDGCIAMEKAVNEDD
jgi:hypothetical protein